MLLAALTALLLVIGQAVGGRSGLMIALVMALGMNFVSYWFSDSIVLKMHDARAIGPEDSPELFSMTQRLAQRAGIPMPKLYVIPDESPNAFATGRNPSKGAVAVTQGLLRALDTDQVEGVIAHELAHIAHRDTLVMTVAATLAGAISSLGHMAMFMGGARHHDDEEDSGGGMLGGLVAMLVAPIAASLIQMAISRSREYMADRAAAEYSGKPLALASGLRRISQWSNQIPMHVGSPATAHMYISNPFKGGLASLFSTHPPTDSRIAELEKFAQEKNLRQ